MIEKQIARVRGGEIHAERAVVGEFEAERVRTRVFNGDMDENLFGRGVSGIIHRAVIETYRNFALGRCLALSR